MATAIERARLAAATNILRPEWPTTSIQTFIDKPQHRDRPYHDLTVALTWLATDPDTHTPARLDKHGPWWTATNTNATLGPPKWDPATDAVSEQATPRAAQHAARIRAEHKAHRTTPIDPVEARPS